jgi:RHS repeat-associated protein
VSADNHFSGTTVVSSGTSSIQVAAKDYSGNLRTNTYDVSQSGSTTSYTYDSNGNLTGDGTRTFEWDAENRLLAVEAGTHRSEFTYDGLGRRVRIVEKVSGSTTSDHWFLWCGIEMCEERNSAGSTVTKRFFGQGVEIGSTDYFYTTDHLGSIREMTDGSGAIQARYDYDPYGRQTKLSGSLDSDFGYTGHYEHAPTGLALTLYRAYDPSVGRWLSEDPLGFGGGPNLYAYVEGSPINNVDLLGLQAVPAMPWPGAPPIFFPPVAIPGTKENDDFVKGTMGAIRSIEGWITIAAILLRNRVKSVPPAIPIPTTGDPDKCNSKKCPPCKPPVGTIAYRIDEVPPHKPHFPIEGTHVHLFRMNQNPNNCRCFWQKIDVISPPPPPGAVPF